MKNTRQPVVEYFTTDDEVTNSQEAQARYDEILKSLPDDEKDAIAFDGPQEVSEEDEENYDPGNKGYWVMWYKNLGE